MKTSPNYFKRIYALLIFFRNIMDNYENRASIAKYIEQMTASEQAPNGSQQYSQFGLPSEVVSGYWDNVSSEQNHMNYQTPDVIDYDVDAYSVFTEMSPMEILNSLNATESIQMQRSFSTEVDPGLPQHNFESSNYLQFRDRSLSEADSRFMGLESPVSHFSPFAQCHPAQKVDNLNFHHLDSVKNSSNNGSNSYYSHCFDSLTKAKNNNTDLNNIDKSQTILNRVNQKDEVPTKKGDEWFQGKSYYPFGKTPAESQFVKQEEAVKKAKVKPSYSDILTKVPSSNQPQKPIKHEPKMEKGGGRKSGNKQVYKREHSSGSDEFAQKTKSCQEKWSNAEEQGGTSEVSGLEDIKLNDDLSTPEKKNSKALKSSNDTSK